MGLGPAFSCYDALGSDQKNDLGAMELVQSDVLTFRFPENEDNNLEQ